MNIHSKWLREFNELLYILARYRSTIAAHSISDIKMAKWPCTCHSIVSPRLGIFFSMQCNVLDCQQIVHSSDLCYDGIRISSILYIIGKIRHSFIHVNVCPCARDTLGKVDRSIVSILCVGDGLFVPCIEIGCLFYYKCAKNLLIIKHTYHCYVIIIDPSNVLNI